MSNDVNKILDESINNVIIELGNALNSDDLQDKADSIAEAVHLLTSGVRAAQEIND